MTQTSTINLLKAQIEDLEAELRKNPIYRELEILRDTVRKLEGLSSSTAATPSEPPRPIIGSITIREAVLRALEERGYPMSTKDLVTVLPVYGKTVGGKDPAVNLASILSKDDTFIYLKEPYKGWWPRNKDPDPIGLYETDAPASAPQE